MTDRPDLDVARIRLRAETCDPSRTMEDRVTLLAHCERLEEALRFYSDEKNWTNRFARESEDRRLKIGSSRAAIDKGQRARVALGDQENR